MLHRVDGSQPIDEQTVGAHLVGVNTPGGVERAWAGVGALHNDAGGERRAECCQQDS